MLPLVPRTAAAFCSCRPPPSAPGAGLGRRAGGGKEPVPGGPAGVGRQRCRGSRPRRGAPGAGTDRAWARGGSGEGLGPADSALPGARAAMCAPCVGEVPGATYLV